MGTCVVYILRGGKYTLGVRCPIKVGCSGLSSITLSGVPEMCSSSGDTMGGAVGVAVACGVSTGMSGCVGGACTLGGDCGKYLELAGLGGRVSNSLYSL